jgi:hypothetical protein
MPLRRASAESTMIAPGGVSEASPGMVSAIASVDRIRRAATTGIETR